MSATPELEPCPFCKGEAYKHEADFEIVAAVAIGCQKCGALGPFIDVDGEKPEEADWEKAIAAWNARATPAPAPTPELEELERLYAEATPGPWGIDWNGPHAFLGSDSAAIFGAAAVRADDAALIVALHNAFPGLLAALRAKDALQSTLFDAIKHGDEDHQAWLKEAIEAHFAGLPVPEPRGGGRKDAEIAELREIVALADELVNGGGLYTVAYADTPKLCVRKKADKSDPHFRLCLALEQNRNRARTALKEVR